MPVAAALGVEQVVAIKLYQYSVPFVCRFMLSLVLAVLADQYLEAMRHEKQQRREEHEEAERNGMPPPVCWLRRTWDAFAYRMVECWQAPLPGLLGRSREWRWRKRLQVQRATPPLAMCLSFCHLRSLHCLRCQFSMRSPSRCLLLAGCGWPLVV